jgi:hypothetical protein
LKRPTVVYGVIGAAGVSVAFATILALNSALFILNYDAQAQEEQEQVVTIVSHRPVVENGNKTTSIVGEVRNDSPNNETIGLVDIYGKFYDSNGELIHLQDTFAKLFTIRPGEKAPFHIPINDPIIGERIADYTLDTEVNPVFSQDKPAVLNIAVSKHGIVEKPTTLAGAT